MRLIPDEPDCEWWAARFRDAAVLLALVGWIAWFSLGAIT